MQEREIKNRKEVQRSFLGKEMGIVVKIECDLIFFFLVCLLLFCFCFLFFASSLNLLFRVGRS